MQVCQAYRAAGRAVALFINRLVGFDMALVLDIDILPPFLPVWSERTGKAVQTPMACIPCRHGAVEQLVSQRVAPCNVVRLSDSQGMQWKLAGN